MMKKRIFALTLVTLMSLNSLSSFAVQIGDNGNTMRIAVQIGDN